MTDHKWLAFGDVLKIDTDYPGVPQPDHRRWMVLSFDDRRKWTTLFLGGWPTSSRGSLTSHWSSLTGFVRVEDDET